MGFLTETLLSLPPVSEIVTYSQCPACDNGNISHKFTAIDHTVTKKAFDIWECAACSLRFTQNVPSREAIAPYYQSQAYVSHSETKKGIINKLYHWVRTYTLRAKRRMIIHLTTLRKGKLLDIGAGTGSFAALMQKAGWEVTGLEPDETARQNARQHHQLELQPIEKLGDQPANHFDVITLWHVLEHVHDLHRYLDTFYRLLAPRGTLFVAVPNYTSLDADTYEAHWAAWDVPRHLYHFSPHSMDILAERHGMQVVAHKPMWFDSFYVSMLSEQYKNGFNNLPAAFWNGWLSNWGAFDDVSKCSSVIYVIRKK
ncbi:MAG: SAM-dependent methyltransferase [Chitinophagaceae bacterium]|nr:SAM-dependent methyltransferase [Chitinophagaceae bacterium]